MMFGFHLNRELMGGGGGSSGGGGGRGGSSNPGAPGGESGTRGGGSSGGSRGGRSGGPGGGSDPGNRGGGSSSSSGGSNRGGSTNPGRPGGESGTRGSAAPGSRGSNSGGPGRDTPGAPDAADDNRGSTMGRDGGLAGSSSSSGRGGSESIAGSRQARSRFSFNSPDAGQMMSFGQSRDAGLGPVGGFRGTSALSGSRDSGISSGSVTDGLDRTTPGYQMVVGDNELSAEEQSRESRARALSMQPNPDTIAMQQAAVENTNSTFGDRATLPGVGPLQAGFALARNAMMASEVVGENEAMAASRNLSPATLNTTTADMAQAMNSASLSDTTGGLIGNSMAPGMAAVGDYSAQDTSTDGRNQGGGPPPEEVIYPPEQQPGAPAGPAPDRRFGGSLGNYGSYARRFFSRT